MQKDLLDARGYASQDVFEALAQAIEAHPAQADACVAAAGDLIRFNTLLSVARAGTGHLGASLSMADLVAEIYFRQGTFTPANISTPDRDLFVLSKGHAAPGHYAALAARGYFPTAKLDRLRRWHGLPGHSHVSVPGVDGNTGSLAMGLSKAVGFAIARQRIGIGGDVYAMVGDGELQEGQIWEALLSAASFGCTNLFLVLDANDVQTDQRIEDILVYRDLPGTLRALGFAVEACDGHDPSALREAFTRLRQVPGKPRCLLAHTIKGKGVSFMEHPRVLAQPGARYFWHNKAPNSEQLALAHAEIVQRVTKTLSKTDVVMPRATAPHQVPLEPAAVGIKGKPLVPAFAQAVLDWARRDPRVVVLDADLEEDCGLTPFRQEFPERFFELGIMEQHMCSAASAFAAQGLLPVINSYAAFLTSRSNEQIYNLVCDRQAQFLLVGHLAGVIPATPGMSHQAFRDVGCLRSIPGLRLVQPMSPEECQALVARYGRGELGPRVYLRLVMAPSAAVSPAADPALPIGVAQVVRKGGDATILSSGPVMMGEALAAAELLAAQGIDVEVCNHPWLAEFDKATLHRLLWREVPVIVAEDHHAHGGLGEGLFAALATQGKPLPPLGHIALHDLPDTGFRAEALAGMGLDRDHIVRKVITLVRVRRAMATGRALAATMKPLLGKAV